MSDTRLSLFGDRPTATPTDRLFFAVFPDAPAAERIAAEAVRLRVRHRLRGKPLAADRFHITLLHIGDYHGLPKGIVVDAIAGAEKVSAPPVEVAFDQVGSFATRNGNLPLVLRASEADALLAFQRILCTEMIKAGVRYKGGAQFTPHVTLLYDAASVPIEPIDPIRWTAADFVLVHSLLGQTRHIPLARWSLSEDGLVES